MILPGCLPEPENVPCIHRLLSGISFSRTSRRALDEVFKNYLQSMYLFIRLFICLFTYLLTYLFILTYFFIDKLLDWLIDSLTDLLIGR